MYQIGGQNRPDHYQKEQEYLQASASAYGDARADIKPVTFAVEAGDFDLRGFEIAHLDFFDVKKTPLMTLEEDYVKFSVECLRRMNSDMVL